MFKNVLISALTIYGVTTTVSLNSIIQRVHSDQKDVIMARVEPEAAPFVGSYLNRLKIQSELQPNNEMMQQRFASISITFKNVVTMQSPGSDVVRSCKKDNNKMNLSLQMAKKTWNGLSEEQRQYVIDTTLDSCLMQTEKVAGIESEMI